MAKRLACVVDQVITDWEIAHHGKMIFGEYWRRVLRDKLMGGEDD